MKNRYCLYCGTLLPEDGTCLRCGAKYELDPDGNLKVIPRKVKKVSAKKIPRRKYIAKKIDDPSKADTQKIHIPEDVFSSSNDAKEKHADWTGAGKETEPFYVPNFVMHGESDKQTNQDNNASEEKKAKANSSAKRISTSSLLAVFLIITLLSASLSYLLLKQHYDGNSPKTTTTEKQIANEGKQSVDYSPVLNAYKEYEEKGFRRITSDYINETLDYTVDAKSNKIAYVYSDLNCDGIEELLISLTDEANIYHQIYDVYTFSSEPVRLVPEETWFHPDSNEELCFFTNGDICYSEGPMENIGDSRIKAYKYVIYDFPKGSTQLLEKEKYELSFDSEIGLNSLSAKRTIDGKTESCSVDEFGAIDDKYRGYLINNEPYEENYFNKWNPDNPVLQIAEYPWKHLIEKVFNDGISEDNRIAITTYQDILSKLYYSLEKHSSIYYDENYAWPFSVITDYANEDESVSNYVEKREELEQDGEYFIDDINNDGVLELGLKNRIGPNTAFGVTIYRCTGLSHVNPVISGFDFEFYKNGDLAGLLGHNQTRGEMWPAYYYKLDGQNGYKELGLAYSWNKTLSETDFPDSVDKDGNGVVYTTDGGESWIDDQAYNAWFNNTINSTKRDIQWYKINENNVEKFKQIAISKIT